MVGEIVRLLLVVLAKVAWEGESKPDVLMSMNCGSSSQSPATPRGARVLTKASARTCRYWPDVST